MGQLPFVSLIVPCRNESKYLSRSIGSLVAQDYPVDRLEIIVADGVSEDGSAEIARALLSEAEQASRVVTNPERVTPAAFNLGLELARGDVIIIVSAHCELDPDYVRLAVTTLDRTGADCVGGPMRPRGESSVATAIAMALGSPFGVGAATYRTRTEHRGFVDTVPFGAYRREVFERVGVFDPEFVRNQDSELNFRITRDGGRIYLEPRLRSVYYARGTLRALWRQHFHTGASKLQILAKHGRMPRWGHYIPGAFVAMSALSVVLGLVFRRPLIALAVLGPYAVLALAASLWSSRQNLRLFPLVVVTMPTLHFSYGLGFLYGLARVTRSRMSYRARAPRELPRPSSRS